MVETTEINYKEDKFGPDVLLQLSQMEEGVIQGTYPVKLERNKGNQASLLWKTSVQALLRMQLQIGRAIAACISWVIGLGDL